MVCYNVDVVDVDEVVEGGDQRCASAAFAEIKKLEPFGNVKSVDVDQHGEFVGAAGGSDDGRVVVTVGGFGGGLEGCKP